VRRAAGVDGDRRVMSLGAWVRRPRHGQLRNIRSRFPGWTGSSTLRLLWRPRWNVSRGREDDDRSASAPPISAPSRSSKRCPRTSREPTRAGSSGRSEAGARFAETPCVSADPSPWIRSCVWRARSVDLTSVSSSSGCQGSTCTPVPRRRSSRRKTATSSFPSIGITPSPRGE